MTKLTALKFDGSCSIHVHVLEMANLATKLKVLGMNVDKFFLVWFILYSLPSQRYGPFQMNYDTITDKWSVHITSIVVQEETRLKNQKVHSIYFVSHQEVEK